MAALLTSVLENSAKVAEYIAECRELGIRLLPPDVNESEANFTVSGGNIRFGLVAIKGIGWGVINGLVAERELGGEFRSFEEFCRRMAGKDLNRRAIDSLIRSGAFDSMGCKRRALMQIAGPVIDSVNRAQKENIDGQFDLFGDGASATAPSARRSLRSRCRTWRNTPPARRWPWRRRPRGCISPATRWTNTARSCGASAPRRSARCWPTSRRAADTAIPTASLSRSRA